MNSGHRVEDVFACNAKVRERKVATESTENPNRRKQTLHANFGNLSIQTFEFAQVLLLFARSGLCWALLLRRAFDVAVRKYQNASFLLSG